MGIPITSTVYEELLNLSKEDKIKVIAWIAETMLGEENSATAVVEEPKASSWPPKNMKVADDLPDKDSWSTEVSEPHSSLDTEEWKNRVKAVAGLWSDLPDDFGDDIVSSRTISTREIKLDD